MVKMFLLITVRFKAMVFKVLLEGQRVQFTVSNGKKGLQASGITVI